MNVAVLHVCGAGDDEDDGPARHMLVDAHQLCVCVCVCVCMCMCVC